MKPTKRLLALWFAVLTLPAVVPAIMTGCTPVKPVAPPTVTTTGCNALSVIKVPEGDLATISPTLLKRISDHNVAYKRLCNVK